MIIYKRTLFKLHKLGYRIVFKSEQKVVKIKHYYPILLITFNEITVKYNYYE